jgi:solute carrier family 41
MNGSWLNNNYLWTSLDNISTPLASCLSDLLTLTLLSFLATFLTLPRLPFFQFPLVFTLFFILILGLAIFASLRNAVSRPLLKDGLSWIPLLCAMAISSGTGLVLDEFVTKWKDFGSLAIVISGQVPSTSYNHHPVVC